MNNSQKQIEFIQQTLLKSYWAVRDCNDLIFEEGDRSTQEFKASIFLSQAMSLIGTCKSIYYSNLEFLEDTRLEDIFSQFDEFVREISNNISTNHSHQWTDIQFENFKKSLSVLIDLD